MLRTKILASFVILLTTLISCSPGQHLPKLPDLERIPLLPTHYQIEPPSEAVLAGRHPEEALSNQINFETDVKPILDSRCVVCHACYDAPCQLKLGATDGLERGATKTKVYDGKRLFPAEPTRLFTDAQSVTQWREKGFFPVLDEQIGNSEAALNNSLLYQMIKLKKDQPFPRQGLLPQNFKLEGYRDLSCPTPDDFSTFKKEHPQWGMPYGLPGLDKKEHKLLTQWLKQGAVFPPRKALSTEIVTLVSEWENFLNQPDKKSQLISRYIYEHLAFGHLYFSDASKPGFFSLVRSRTAPGENLELIATSRPYDAPQAEKVYYRLRRVEETIVDKSHLPYALNQNKMQRFKQLFWAPDYEVLELPGYSPKTAANPFKTFAAIPAKSRYQFLLDNAHYFIANFIKGPVCWGPIALNVINDRFFVVFTNPDTDPVSNNDHFLQLASPVLSLPAELENNFNLTAAWTLYARQQKKYLNEKDALLIKNKTLYNSDFIWPGNGANGDGALTIFRHHDSASVLKGFIGDTPKTAWVIDYPIFERIYYLLVAGFDVYGNVGHQLSTRLYMDFLRMEGERNFINFLPDNQGRFEYQRWYKHIPERLERFLFDKNIITHKINQKNQESGHTKPRLLKLFTERTQAFNSIHNTFNYYPIAHTQNKSTDSITQTLLALTHIKGKQLRHLPDVSYLHIKTENKNNDRVYTLIKNKGHSSVHFMFGEDIRRLPKEDNLTLVHGLVGSYPNYIYNVPVADLSAFIKRIGGLKKNKNAIALNKQWGLQRTHPRFWEEIDWLLEKNKLMHGIDAGQFDLNRYLNQ